MSATWSFYPYAVLFKEKADPPGCNVRPPLHATSECARSQLPGLGQASRGFLSASGAGDAQGTARHGQQAKDSRTTRAARLRNVRQRAPIRPRGGGRHKGACEGGERDWDGFFCSSPVSPGPWATPRRSAASSATKNRRLSATDSRRRPRGPTHAPLSSMRAPIARSPRTLWSRHTKLGLVLAFSRPSACLLQQQQAQIKRFEAGETRESACD